MLPGRNQWSVRNLGESSSARKPKICPSFNIAKCKNVARPWRSTWCHGGPDECLSISRYIPLFPIFNNYIMRNFLFSSLFLLLRGKYFLLFFSSSMNTFNILFLSSCSTIQHILKSMDCEITAWRSDSLQILAVLFSFSPLFFLLFFSVFFLQYASLYHISDVYILIIVVLMNTYICMYRKRKGFRF